MALKLFLFFGTSISLVQYSPVVLPVAFPLFSWRKHWAGVSMLYQVSVTAITYHIIQNSFMPFRCSSKPIFEYIATPQSYLSVLLFEATQCFKNSFRVLSRKELTIKRINECRSNAH